MSSSQSSPGNGFPGFTGSSEELTALMLRMTVPLPGILSLACALEGLNDWEVQHLLNVVGAGNAVAAFQDSEWEPVWKVVRAKLPPLLADAFDEHMHSTPQEACATRMAQTAILSVVTRVKRERFFMSKYLP
jgi:cytochrome c oxidase subunit IV